jgi:hypothetical protein
MKTPRALLPVLLAAGLAVAACGGTSSGGTSSAAGSSASAAGSAASTIASAVASASLGGSASSGGGGGAVAASDQAFCDTFTNAKDRFSTSKGLPTKEDIAKIKQFADDLEKTAPADQKENAKVLAAYFRFIANAAEHQGNMESTDAAVASQIQKISPAIAGISVWAATHCNKG